jgi:hypothetical protein
LVLRDLYIGGVAGNGNDGAVIEAISGGIDVLPGRGGRSGKSTGGQPSLLPAPPKPYASAKRNRSASA